MDSFSVLPLLSFYDSMTIATTLSILTDNGNTDLSNYEAMCPESKGDHEGFP